MPNMPFSTHPDLKVRQRDYDQPIRNRLHPTMRLAIVVVAFFFTCRASGQLVTFNFSGSGTAALAPTTTAPNVTVSDFGLSSGGITTGVTTGAYFPNEPYIQATGFTATSQSTAKYFFFTITAAAGYTFDISQISFNAYATGTGPSAFGFGVGTTNLYSIDAPDSSLLSVSQTVSNQTGLTSAQIRIQGFLNNSRSSNGMGDFRLDDVVISGNVSPVPEPATVFAGLALIGLAGFRERQQVVNWCGKAVRNWRRDK